MARRVPGMAERNTGERNRTVIIISHNIRQIIDSDVIYV